MKSVDRILGEAIRPPTNRELTDPEWAYTYARDVIKGRWLEGESTIAKDPVMAYYYAINAIKDRFPEGEAAIAKDPLWAYHYAYFVNSRWLEAEETIANSEYKDRYLEQFPEARDDWSFNGWIDWLDV